MEASGISLSNSGGFELLRQFHVYLSDYKIIVFDCLNPDGFMFSRNSFSTMKLNLLYDRDNKHYNIIKNIKGALLKQ